jgi:hypothetical protein
VTHPLPLSEERVREIRSEFEDLLLDVETHGQQSDGPGVVSAHYTSLSISEVIALTALRANSGEGWQSIETAPKDGTEIDVWAVNEVGHGGMRIIGVKWDWITDWDGTAYEGWTDMYPTRWGSKYHPTHWMSPVAAPAPEHQEADQQ